MICSFCGGENRTENRFCGMCGVRLERRKLERRTQQNTTVKCDSCGHVNEQGYKFCGMCGTRIERRLAERRGDTNRATAVANARLAGPEPRYSSSSSSSGGAAAVMIAPQEQQRGPAVVEAPSEPSRQQYRAEPAREPQVTSIPGPSFLGLSSEPVGESEYLLEDEPGSPRGFRSLVILVILAAIGTLIFMEWRANMNTNPKPQPTQQAAPGTSGATKQPTSNPATAQAAMRKMGAGISAAGQAALKAVAGKPKEEANLNPAADEKKSSKRFARTDRDPEASETAAAAPVTPAPVRAKPSASLLRAQQYLQGRGVPQSCAQGMRYLKAAADENDPNAAVQMAALYSSGHCVRMDRVQAYRWFSSAHDMTPGNRWIEKNMNQLWAQMSTDERHRAVL